MVDLEISFPCPSTVTGCVKPQENPAPKGCCGTTDNPKIITKDAQYEAVFEWTYEGTLFNLISNSENWTVEVLLENMGGSPLNHNIQKSEPAQHVQTALSQTLTKSVIFNYNEFQPGQAYRPIFKLDLKVGGSLVVCAFDEGRTFFVAD